MLIFWQLPNNLYYVKFYYRRNKLKKKYIKIVEFLEKLFGDYRNTNINH